MGTSPRPKLFRSWRLGQFPLAGSDRPVESRPFRAPGDAVGAGAGEGGLLGHTG